MYRFLTHQIFKVKHIKNCHYFLLISLIFTPIATQAFSEEELKWFESDQEEKSLDVNEGKLHFLKDNRKNILHSENTISIAANSIDTGWVSLQQCYYHLDKLPEVEITYQYRFMKQLAIFSKKNIETAIINDQSITLKNISDNAEICVTATVRVFYQNPDGTFSLVNGPYHRRFLDGYYPYRVSLKVNYPEQLLKLANTIPASQPGFIVQQQHNQIFVDTVFEGILNTEIIFTEIKKPN